MEHMFFQGTPRRPSAAEIDSEIEAKGGWTNAWTAGNRSTSGCALSTAPTSPST